MRASRASRLPLVLVGLLAAVYALLFGWLSIQEYEAFQMHALDMGNMGQAAWNTLHGHPFYFTNMRLAYNLEAWKTTTRLSFHVEALFPVVSLVYLIYPHPESLLILQTLALAAGGFAVYLLARDVLRNVWLALVFVLAYLLFPTLEALNLYEFHPVALATPLLLFAFWFAWRRRYLPFIVCCLLAMGTKEEIGLVVAMFGLYISLVQREWKVGIGTAAIGVVWSLFAVFVIEKHFRQPGSLSYVHTRYKYLGHGLHGAINTALRHPGKIAAVVFTWPKLGYLQRLFAPVGFVCLLAPLALLLGLPTFAINLLSNDLHMVSGLGDNSAELVSVVTIAGTLGTRHALDLLQRWLPVRLTVTLAAVYVLGMALWNQHLNGFTPLGAAYQLPAIGAHQRIEARFVAMIPRRVPVSTQDVLDPHLSSRHYLYLFEDTGTIPPPLPAAHSILLDASGPTYPLPSYQLHDRAKSRLAGNWGVVAADDGLILLRQGVRNTHIPARFYRYAYAGHTAIAHRLHLVAHGVEVAGYNVQHADLANHRIPNLDYTIYIRPLRRLSANMQPVIFERMGSQIMSIDCQPLGLDWLPASRWRPGQTYAVRMQSIETDWATPGRAQLFVEILPFSPVDPLHQCTPALWQRHGRLASIGSLDIQF